MLLKLGQCTRQVHAQVTPFLRLWRLAPSSLLRPQGKLDQTLVWICGVQGC